MLEKISVFLGSYNNAFLYAFIANRFLSFKLKQFPMFISVLLKFLLILYAFLKRIYALSRSSKSKEVFPKLL